VGSLITGNWFYSLIKVKKELKSYIKLDSSVKAQKAFERCQKRVNTFESSN